MNRNYILLAVLLIACFGCSDKPSLESTQEQLPPPKEAVASVDPAADDSAQGSDTSASLPASEAITKDAMTLYRDAQALMKEGRHEEGYETAQEAMLQFVAEDIDLPWLMLESIEAGDKHVDVHFNMGERERNMPDDGIVRPLSFRVWSKGDDAEILQVIDYEIGRSHGESVTAAIGEMTGEGHANYGILDVNTEYSTIRQRVVNLVMGK